MTKVVLIGAGHLAFYFYKQFLRCKEVNLTQWFNRSIEKIDFAKTKVAIDDYMIQEAFSKFDTANKGYITVSDVKDILLLLINSMISDK